MLTEFIEVCVEEGTLLDEEGMHHFLAVRTTVNSTLFRRLRALGRNTILIGVH